MWISCGGNICYPTQDHVSEYLYVYTYKITFTIVRQDGISNDSGVLYNHFTHYCW